MRLGRGVVRLERRFKDIAAAFLVKVMLASLEPETLLAWCVLVLRHGTMGRLWCGVAPALGVTVAVRLVSVLRHAQRTRSQANFTSKVFLVSVASGGGGGGRGRGSGGGVLLGLDRVQQRFVEQDLEALRVGV